MRWRLLRSENSISPVRGRRRGLRAVPAVVLAPLLLVASGYLLARYTQAQAVPVTLLSQWQAEIDRLRFELDQFSQASEWEAEDYARRMARVEAGMVPLAALGEQLVADAGLTGGEFDFAGVAADDGLAEGNASPRFAAAGTVAGCRPDLGAQMTGLEARFRALSQQLDMLSDVEQLRRRALGNVGLARPVAEGWLSSDFGYRADPFSGDRAWHDGMDFAGRAGTEVLAVAAGVVTWSGEKSGYGRLIEINHDGEFVTRYAHNRQNHVQVGELVSRGQTIATMGSSGRATGPHVHFEVRKAGRSVDPGIYLKRS